MTFVLSCSSLISQSKEVCDAGLAGAKAAGICNIVALRGDPPKGQEAWVVTEGGEQPLLLIAGPSPTISIYKK